MKASKYTPCEPQCFGAFKEDVCLQPPKKGGEGEMLGEDGCCPALQMGSPSKCQAPAWRNCPPREAQSIQPFPDLTHSAVNQPVSSCKTLETQAEPGSSTQSPGGPEATCAERSKGPKEPSSATELTCLSCRTSRMNAAWPPSASFWAQAGNRMRGAHSLRGGSPHEEHVSVYAWSS